MRLEREVDDDAEVAAAAAQCPEQVLVVGVISNCHGAVSGHDCRGDEVVESEPVQADQVPDASAKRQAANARVAKRSARKSKTCALTGRIDVLPERPATAGHLPRLAIDNDAAHQPQVDDD